MIMFCSLFDTVGWALWGLLKGVQLVTNFAPEMLRGFRVGVLSFEHGKLIVNKQIVLLLVTGNIF